MDYTLSVIALTILAHFMLYRIGKFIFFELLALATIVLHGLYFFGPIILALLAITYIVSVAAELVALKTPMNCFGVKYWYRLNHPFFSTKIYLLGVYPLEISLAWIIVKYASYIIALLICQAFSLPVIITIFLVPTVLVSLDFIIDPLSVHTDKLWRWQSGSIYFGIPIQNFAGWYVVGFVATVLYISFSSHQPIRFHLFHILPLVLYGTFLSKIPKLMKLDRRMAIIGSLPAIIWTILGGISLYILYLQHA